MSDAIPPDDSARDRSERREVAHRQRRRRLLIGGGALVVVIAIVVAVVVLAGGSDDSDDTAGGGSNTSGSPLTSVAPTTNAAKPLAGGVCSGAQLAGQQMSSSVSGQSQLGVFAFSNQSKTSCTLEGVATLKLLDADGKSVPSTATPGGGALSPDLTAQEVTVDPGAQTSLVLAWAPVGGGCTQVRTIEFTMPESKGAVKVDTQFSVCNNGALNISPMQAGVAKG